MNVIETHHLKKYYGSTRGLEDGTLEVKENEIFGFIGPNGAGKTTLIRLLLDLIKKTDGSAEVFGKNPEQHAPWINARVGFLPSEAFFFPEMKGCEVIRFYSEIRHADHARVDTLIDRLKFDTKKTISELSFGNRKKLGIIVALMHDPDILVLDEPTTGLDPLMKKSFLDLLLEEKKKGRTIFLSSHVLSEVEKVCDRVAFIKDGIVTKPVNMNELGQRNKKMVKIKPDDLKLDLQGLEKTETLNNRAVYTYEGDLKRLLDYLKNSDITDVSINDATLEDLFLDYYKGETS